MIEQLLPILDLAMGELFGVAIVFLRIGAMTMLLPAFGERSLPMRLRLGIAFCFSFAIAPSITTPDNPSWLLIGTETLTGALFGLLLRLFVMSLQIAGTIAGQSTSLSQMLGNATAIDPQPAMGAILTLGGLTLATILGLHIKLFAYMLLCYDLVPIGQLINAETVYSIGLSQVRLCFYLGFTLSAPFLLGALVYNLILGFINRAMPQLMVSFIGAPAVTLGGMILLMVSAPYMLQTWIIAMDKFMLAPGATP